MSYPVKLAENGAMTRVKSTVAEKLMHFLQKHQVKRLNIVGSNEGDEPGVYDWVLATLKKTQETMERESKFPNQTRHLYSRR